MFSGSHEDLENTAQQLYASPPCPQHLCLDALSIKMPQNIPPIPGTARHNKIDKIEKNGFTVEHSTLATTLQSLRDEFKSVKKPDSEAGWIRFPLQI